jgi:DNA-binding MarR family transcriptional regulator
MVTSRMQLVLRQRGLSFARFEVLLVLDFSRRGAMPLGKIGERLMAHPASVTNLVDRLEAANLVTRSSNPGDRRAVLASITPRGRAMVQELAPKLAEMQFGLADLGSDGCRALTESLTGLRKAAGDFVD